MSLEIYYPNDIRRVLLALASAGAMHGPAYIKALYDVALAFGMQPPPAKTWCVMSDDDGQRELVTGELERR